MNKILAKIKSLKKTRLDILLFYIFIATSTLSVRKVITSFKIGFSFNEYTGVYIYLSDLVLILMFFVFILCNINNILSSIKTLALTLLKLFHVEQFDKNPINTTTKNIVPRGTIHMVKKTYTHIINNIIIIFPLFMAFFALISILWTTNKTIATFRSFKLLEFTCLYYYIIYIVPRGTMSKENPNLTTNEKSQRLFHVEQNKTKPRNLHLLNKVSMKLCSTYLSSKQAWNKILAVEIVPRGTIFKNASSIIIIIGLLQSIIGISQFLTRKSLGIFWLKESIISTSMPGVAKIILNNETYIRAYGLFPHPNIFGGYLAISIILTIFSIKLFHVEQKRSTFLIIGLFLQSACLLLTFSKSAIIGLMIGLLYIKHTTKEIVPPAYPADRRGTISKVTNTLRLFHVEQSLEIFTLILLILVFLFTLIKPDVNSLFIKSLTERGFYLNVSRGTFLQHPLIGVGAGQFILQVSQIPNIQDWQLQPVHNVLLLVLNEYGLFITIGFVFFLFIMFMQRNCSTWNNSIENMRSRYLKGILLAFVFISMFDHYFWDIQQGQIFLWIILALIAQRDKPASHS